MSEATVPALVSMLQASSRRYRERLALRFSTAKAPLQAKPEVSIDKEKIEHEVRRGYKRSWRGPGHSKGEFSEVPVLKARVLDGWQLSRIGLTERSYNYPKGYKGMHVLTCQGDYFKNVGLAGLPQTFKEFAQKLQLQHEEYVLRPSRYGKLDWQRKLDTFRSAKPVGFKINNTARSQQFGFGSESTRRFQLSLRCARTNRTRF